MVATALGKTSEKTMAGKTFTASAWTAGHLQQTIDALKEKHPDKELRIIQPCFHKGVKKSKGSHDYDGVFDVWIDGMTGPQAQKFLRSQGWAAWFRHTGDFADDIHIHMATIPPGLTREGITAKKVGDAYAKLGTQVGYLIDGGYTRKTTKRYTSQIVDYYRHAFGLQDQHEPDSDTSWFPADIAKTIHQEDDMDKKELLEVLNSKAGQAAISEAVINKRLVGQTGGPKNGRTVETSINLIYNLLLDVDARLKKLEGA